MSNFVAGGVQCGADFDSGASLIAGAKFDRRMFAVSIDSPTDQSMVLKDASYGADKQLLYSAVDDLNFAFSPLTKIAHSRLRFRVLTVLTLRLKERALCG
jgi:hypothetical protein